MSETLVEPGAPQAGRHWMAAVLGATTTTVVCVVPGFLVGGLAVQIADELHFDPAGLGLAVSVCFGVSALSSVPAGALVERFGVKRTAMAAISISATGLFAIALFARTLAALVAFLAIAGTANALGQLASNAAVANRVPPGRQGLSFGIKQSAIPLSTLLAGISVPLIALNLGWRWAFALAAGLALVALLLVPPDARAGKRPAAAREGRPTAALVVIGVAATLAAGGANALGAFLVDAAVAGGLAPGPAGLALSAGGAINLTVRLVSGWFADRRTGGHIAVVAGSLVLGAVGLALLTQPGLAALAIGVALGFGLGWSWPGLLNYSVVRLHPQAPAAATSITQTGIYTGACLGPLLFGAVAATRGYPVAWLTASIAMLLAAAGMLVARATLIRRSRANGG